MAVPPPRSDIEWSKLGLTLNFNVNGHVEARYHTSTGKWTSPTLTADPNISVSGMSPGLNYGQQCYEGLKAFRRSNVESDTDGKITIFRPQFHAARMGRSAESVSLPPPPEELFLECVRKSVAANAEFVPPADTDAYLYIRPVLFGASTQLGLAPPEEIIFAVYVHPTRPYHGSAAIDGVVLEDFDRAAPKGMGGYKVGGNYAPVWKHAAKAKEMGYGITLHLDSATRTLVEEFSTSGFLGCRSEENSQKQVKVLVIPETENAIPSVTSDSMVAMAKREGWTIEKGNVPFESLSSLDEVVAVGTAVAAVPVRSITRLSTKEKFVFSGLDSHLLELSRLIAGIQRGKMEDTEGWCWEVTGFSDNDSITESNHPAEEKNGLVSWATFSSLQKAVLVGMWNAMFLMRG